MLPIHVSIPTTWNHPNTYDKLVAISEQADTAVRNDGLVSLDFSTCTFLHHHAVAFLGGLIRRLQQQGCTVSIDIEQMNTQVRMNLRKNGFLSAFGFDNAVGQSNAIVFREDPFQDAGSYIAYLRDSWLGRGWVDVSERVKDVVSSAFWEIYANAFEHGQSACGVFTCGQFYPVKHEISLSMVDLGIGIPASVRTVKKVQHLDDARAIEWAMGLGNTSKEGNRGLGLDIMENFVALNGGRMDVVSLSGHLVVNNNGKTVMNRRSSFLGTVFNVTLIADNKRYIMGNEIEDEKLFK